MGKKKKEKRRRAKERIEQDLAPFFTKSFIPDQKGDLGLYCGECHKRRPWKGLTTSYEVRASDTFRVWWCDQCGNMLKEDNMSDLFIAQEVEARDG